ncbi:MAG: branched-chain amino acid ABC transporter permease [Deltaproteobacteria bacterium]|nr:branched-chain amino acid ABC transporter permease [Candidatus Anaeroferrophillacea bacterium]
MDFLLQLLISGIVVGSIYALVALGFVLIYKATGVINFAQGEFLTVGAYVCLALVAQLQFPFWLAFLFTLVVAVLMGMLIERVALRPMIGEPIISIIMLTIGLSSVLKGGVMMIWGPNNRAYPQIFSQVPIHVGPVVISQIYLWSVGFAALFLLIFTLFFKFSSAGIAMRATADDQQAALSMGISVKKVFGMAWCIAALVSAVGGILVGNINGVNISLGFFGLKVFPAVILGGLDSIPGAIIGGLIIGMLEAIAAGYIDPLVGGGMKEVIPFMVLVVILMVKPYGFFGTEEIEKV